MGFSTNNDDLLQFASGAVMDAAITSGAVVDMAVLNGAVKDRAVIR